ncbi:hypothetical protein [Pseudonocardia humida]|uniref:Signal transduction histidine kinase n=1 Tax=Pseudonocardia humida TaxID=2800819 RepID=A0ABT1A7P1_9PSEU|nr:hypothetical protein [Pseudonocardia humida]MCO1659041.1 hypothetical protein [Pseudonocardia humida]
MRATQTAGGTADRPRGGDRWSIGVAVAACTTFPVLEVAAIAVGGTPEALLPAVLATVCYLPPFLWIVVAVVGGRRPRGAWWLVGGIGAVLVAAAMTTGTQSLAVFPALAVAAMLLVRPARAPAVLLALVAATAPLAVALGGAVQDFWYPTEVLWLYAVVALVAAVRRLEQARGELSEQALLRERLRIDDELSATVGVALADLADRGERLSGPSRSGPAELAELVAASRRTLAQARRVVRGYQRSEIHAELESAVALLAAAGIPARVVGPRAALLADDEAAVRRQLRSATARLLRGGATGGVVLRVDTEGVGAAPRLVVLPDDTGARARVPG